MKTSVRTAPFLKTAACPASVTLLAFRAGGLSTKASTRVSKHLEGCDFCNAESRLLAHHKAGGKGSRTPEMPIDLRILAESILSRR
jgi:hypothetical protein